MKSEAAPFLFRGVCTSTSSLHHSFTVYAAPEGQVQPAHVKVSQKSSRVTGQDTSRWSAFSGSWSHRRQAACASSPLLRRRSAVQSLSREASQRKSLTRNGARYARAVGHLGSSGGPGGVTCRLISRCSVHPRCPSSARRRHGPTVVAPPPASPIGVDTRFIVVTVSPPEMSRTQWRSCRACCTMRVFLIMLETKVIRTGARSATDSPSIHFSVQNSA
jgi:hypothetical protein